MPQDLPGRRRVVPLVCIALALGACADEPGQNVPLGNNAMASSSNGGGALTEPARATLQLGNEAYRAARFEDALELYRRASREAPGSASPWIGILMAAQKLGNVPLADSASRMATALSGGGPGVHGPDPHAALDSATRARLKP